MSPKGLRHPGRWLWLLVAIPVLVGFARLRFDFDVLNLLPQDAPAVRGLKIYQEYFTSARELILTFRSANAEELEKHVRAVGENLRASTNLVESVTWQPTWIERPQDLAELLAWIWLNQPPETFAELSGRLKDAESQFLHAREQLATSLSPEDIARLGYDPLGFALLPDNAAGLEVFSGGGQDAFTSEDGTFRLMFVQAREELVTYQQCNRWMGKIKEIVETPPSRSDTAPMIGYTGRPAFVAEIGAGMQRDMSRSVVSTATIIALLFWIAHRSLKPLLWLLVLLALILTGTLGLGGFMFGSINVVSMGFAAILLGLSVDYALLHYQEAVSHPNLGVPQVRRVVAPGVAWAAITTIAAFLSLNLGGLPGLAQLGTMVATGVALGALVIVFEYLPPLFPERRGRTDTIGEPPCATEPEVRRPLCSPYVRVALAVTAVLLILIAITLARSLPKLDASANALRPRGSPAYAALAEVQKHFARTGEPLWLIMSAPTDSELFQKAEAVQAWADGEKAKGRIEEFSLPRLLLNNPEAQRVNMPNAIEVAGMTNSLREVAARAGFAEGALGLAEGVMRVWSAAGSGGAFRPTNELSRWILGKAIARTPTKAFALGMIWPATEGAAVRKDVYQDLPEGVTVTSWHLLGQSILRHVQDHLWMVVVPMVILVLVSLILAFRNAVEVALSLGALYLAGLSLLALMNLANWSWNLMNLMAIPLILGTGVDYSIFMQLALRRHGGDVPAVLRSTGRALLLCAGTAMAGFGSLAFSSNAGLAGMGRICALGIACNVIVAIVFLPSWWIACRSPFPGAETSVDGLGPSSLYNLRLWRIGIGLVRIFPGWLTRRIAASIALAYWAVARKRRALVVSNLLPAVRGDRALAAKHARALFRNFGLKVADLLRYESGKSMGNLIGKASGYDDRLAPVIGSGRGALLLAFHLGNWELGAHWLVDRGVVLNVVTQPEPGVGFTELRQAAREKWNVRTTVVGRDPFAFVSVMRQLEEGAVFALLMDRPAPTNEIEVEFFGRPFSASISAAELARATGCALLPTFIILENGNYAAHILPEIPYDRASLRQRENRQKLTQEIVKRYEPVVRQYLSQWYHFVPLWRVESKSTQAHSR